MRGVSLPGACAAATWLALAAASASAAAYPERPLRMIVPQAAGSSTDIVTRFIAQELGAKLGQQVVVDARPGAGGTIGAGIAAKSSADGYTLLMANLSTHGINPWLYPNLPYDAIGDFAPVSMVATGPYVLLAHLKLPATSVKELVALARSKPRELNFASGGNGTGTHLAGELLKLRMRIDMVHVPYKGSAPGMNDVIGGQVALMFIGLPPAMPHIKTGRVRALAVTGAKRAEAAADLPTMMEAGVPDYSADTWFSVLLPAGASPQIVARLNADLTAITRSPEIRQKLLRMGMEAIQSTPEGCRDYMRAEIKKWGQVVKASGASIK